MISISAAEKMNRQYRFQRHIYDATRTHYLHWRQRLIDDLKVEDGSVVEIACGTGWNLIRAAKTYPAARFYGIDISSEMLATARAKIASEGLSSFIRLAQADATAFDLEPLFGINQADRIFISYALSMIPDWPAVIDRAAGSLTSPGALHIVDFGRMDLMSGLSRRILRRWLAHYNVTPRDDLEQVLRAVAKRQSLDLTFEQTRKGYSAYAILRRPRA